MQSYTFVLKHGSERSNRVVDALSRIQLLLTKIKVEVVGFDELNNLHPEDPNFVEAWKACKEIVAIDRTKWLDYLIQDGMLFKGSRLCIPRCSKRENLIKEKQSGGMAGHFGQDKTIAILREHYFRPQMSQDVKKFV